MSGIERILVATDLQLKSAGAVRHGAYLAQQLDAELLVLHVVTSKDLGDRDPPKGASERRPDAAVNHAATELEQHVAAVLEGTPPVPTTMRTAFGDPLGEILDVAREENCGYIVLTVESRSRIGKLLLGSHAQQVLLTSEIPVVGVKPDWQPPAT